MKKQLSSLVPLILLSISLFVGCNDEEVVPTVEINNLKGVVEKGPFVNGSTVTIYELDDHLRQTGKSFTATTDNEGRFELNSAMAFISPYIKVSVNGYYFNEITGSLSDAPITLDALTDVRNKTQVNANMLTHLEYKRVMYLVTKKEIPFQEAKKQAADELLACFLIKDKTVIPEEVSITGNNTSADILLAVSSILLRSASMNNQIDAHQLTESANNFRDDLEKDGTINENMKSLISGASYKLDYHTVKNNVINRYNELGKDITIGKFHHYIDGEGNGYLAGNDYNINPGIITPEDFFKTEKDFYLVALNNFNQMWRALNYRYLIDALITHAVDDQSNLIYNHQITSSDQIIKDTWSLFYRALSQINIVIEKSETRTEPQIKRYSYAGRVYRAYLYMNMIELWGDVPFMTQSNDFIEESPVRKNKSIIMDNLIEELKQAEEYLPEEQDKTICSKYLATAVLQRIYLYRKDYANTLRTSERLINSGLFELSKDYDLVFNDRSNKEAFMLLPVLIEHPTQVETLLLKGKEIPMIRYTETLLAASESYLKTGNTTKAIELINKVRTRNNRTLCKENASKQEIENAILEEWQNDLSKEGVWFNTLIRWELAEERLGIPSYMKLMPIPLQEIQLSAGKITQNTGY